MHDQLLAEVVVLGGDAGNFVVGSGVASQKSKGSVASGNYAVDKGTLDRICSGSW